MVLRKLVIDENSLSQDDIVPEVKTIGELPINTL